MTKIQEKKLKGQIKLHLWTLVEGYSMLREPYLYKGVIATTKILFDLFKSTFSSLLPTSENLREDLHSHPSLEYKHEIDHEHVLVDKDLYLKLIEVQYRQSIEYFDMRGEALGRPNPMPDPIKQDAVLLDTELFEQLMRGRLKAWVNEQIFVPVREYKPKSPEYLDMRGKALSYPPNEDPDPIKQDAVLLDTKVYQRFERDRLELWKKERTTDEKLQVHSHPFWENQLGLDKDYVIITKKAYDKVIEYQQKIWIDKAAETSSLCDSCANDYKSPVKVSGCPPYKSKSRVNLMNHIHRQQSSRRIFVRTVAGNLNARKFLLITEVELNDLINKT